MRWSGVDGATRGRWSMLEMQPKTKEEGDRGLLGSLHEKKRKRGRRKKMGGARGVHKKRGKDKRLRRRVEREIGN